MNSFCHVCHISNVRQHHYQLQHSIILILTHNLEGIRILYSDTISSIHWEALKDQVTLYHVSKIVKVVTRQQKIKILPFWNIFQTQYITFRFLGGEISLIIANLLRFLNRTNNQCNIDYVGVEYLITVILLTV